MKEIVDSHKEALPMKVSLLFYTLESSSDKEDTKTPTSNTQR